MFNGLLQNKIKGAFIFPGQGSQTVGMGKDLYAKFEIAKDIFNRANKAAGFDLTKIMFEGPAETLNLTFNAQPAILAHSIAIFEILKVQSGDLPCYQVRDSIGDQCQHCGNR
jgi:[acyl-carrier-protein] S-malonyltransferase